MEFIAQERDRLLRATTRVVGIVCALISVVGVVSAAAVSALPLVGALLCIAAMVAAFVFFGRSGTVWWTAAILVTGLASLALLFSGVDESVRPLVASAVMPLAGGSLSAPLMAQRGQPFGLGLTIGTGAIVVVVMVWATGGLLSTPVSGALLGWVLIAVVAVWISRSIPRVARRIYSIGTAHRAERQASETEAQRRQGARLLHDTVLATLTLLAHSGVGVSEQAMREQAAEDARLLRHLRLGATPQPSQSGDYSLTREEESPLGQTLESVKQRFGRMGLEVSWHGTGQVLLPSHVLDAFLLALGECLENVRRHAGVGEAHVTIVHDNDMVRAMVTDSGVGFDLTTVSAERLGFKESVVSRLREVGGDAKLFSAPGSGTTVVLEAPR
ncbi:MULTISPECIES: ATP-binding protein [unclassified Curtobacterium]|uniref:sensor histidine kinase n=1 Tax=Bacteria TaxID=2 RepID=UPI000F476944|nr:MULTISPECIES: ATP-binding protein [unclassified Curtobacterium]MBF4586330.1 histidine kinase [Curtobacterium sp. VKM Ac-2887]ROS34366.1 signal transduction histidine kinase [Curtobacterium sp. PhB78]RPE82945.1 signal transduction histidine kinase [Curtobacterium sp. PhB137]TCL80692.1 signal transduction histidine kinase [Curtobacterium sp. PhB128]TCL98816.1 signal transduction histidine kinase [Curtobacterium sp. PhB138]